MLRLVSYTCRCPTLVVRRLSVSATAGSRSKESFRFVVAGGGPGGLSVASYLARNFPKQVAIIEPSQTHYYQPLWTLVGAGLKSREQSVRPEHKYIPPGSVWIQEKAAEFRPDESIVVTSNGQEIEYEYLVVALGLQLDFHKVEGLPEALGTEGVGCNYSFNTVNDTFKAIQNFKGGSAIFTLPVGPVKCQGAPQKIMYLAEDYFRRNGTRKNAQVSFKTPNGVIFAVEKYRKALEGVCRKRDIQVDYFRNLIKIDARHKTATFEYVNDTGTPKRTETVLYEMIHVTPPMGPVNELKASPLVDSSGFVDVNKHTMQHRHYRNVFALGDCCNAPISKTAAAISGQSEAVRHNLMSLVAGRSPTYFYQGYTSCPLVTSRNTCILAEFDYSGQPLETFPIDQGQERISMYYLKADVMPALYWDGLLKGYWAGPGTFRKILRAGFV